MWACVCVSGGWGVVLNQNQRGWGSLWQQSRWRWERRVILIKLIPSKPQDDLIQCLLITGFCQVARTQLWTLISAPDPAPSHRTDTKLCWVLTYTLNRCQDRSVNPPVHWCSDLWRRPPPLSASLSPLLVFRSFPRPPQRVSAKRGRRCDDGQKSPVL